MTTKKQGTRLYITLLFESLRFALHALRVNKLRTALSVLGVTVGIFSIISVFTMVDSLEGNIRGSIESMGDNVVFVFQIKDDSHQKQVVLIFDFYNLLNTNFFFCEIFIHIS